MTDDIPIKVGRLEGRMDANDKRIDRHETFVGENFRVIREGQTRQDEKLDAIMQHISKGSGGLGLLKWVLGIVATASGWIVYFKGSV